MTLYLPPGTDPRVSDFLLKPCWWPVHSGEKAVRISFQYRDRLRPRQGYLFRDGAGFIYLQERKGKDDYLIVEADMITALEASNRSRYRRLGRVEL